MNKKGVMFTLAAVFLVLVILLAFLIQSSNKTKTNIEISNIRTKTTNSFMDSLLNSYLPDALEMTVLQNHLDPDESFLDNKINEIVNFASRTGIEFTVNPIPQINVVTLSEDPLILEADFTITFTITNQDIIYEDITETIIVTDLEIPP
ncbi:MAG: hypothetical protein ISS82_03370 [Nanoarchaeota archaeon]|nr:hypothetical protein [Nanoarchaeota archaeon]